MESEISETLACDSQMISIKGVRAILAILLIVIETQVFLNPGTGYHQQWPGGFIYY